MRGARNGIAWQVGGRAVALISSILVLALSGLVTGQITTTAIEPADQVDVDATSTFDRNPSSGLYTYNYDVSSKKTSKQDIWLIIVETTGSIADAGKPRGWEFGPFVDRPLVMWSLDEEPKEQFILKPGQAKKLSLVSPDPPGPAWIYLQGFTSVPVRSAETSALMETNSALFDPALNSARLQVMAPQAFRSIRINVSPTQIDLSRPTNRVTAVAFGGSNLPSLRSVDLYTWGLGPAAASEIHGTVHFSDLNADGIEDVELHFLTGDLGVRHGDTTICLYGRQEPERVWLRGCATVSVP